MRKILLFSVFIFYSISLFPFQKADIPDSWIRINQLGYTPKSSKVAVWGSKSTTSIDSFKLIHAVSGRIVFSNKAGKPYGAYGPFTQTYRLDFSAYTKSGHYYLQAGTATSPEFATSAATWPASCHTLSARAKVCLAVRTED